MRRPRLLVLWLTVGAAVAGCAYYNGLFNANRLAGDAERAQRQGRSGEARSLWAQAAVKAESVATRYRTSRYRDDALLLWGRALAESQDCRRAVRPLRIAVDSSPDPAIVGAARLLAGRCYVDLRSPDSALLALGPLLESPDSAAATEAQLWRGRALFGLRRYDEAAASFERVPIERSVFERAAAYVALGQAGRAAEVLEQHVEAPYDGRQWLGSLDSLGQLDPERASALVDRLAARPDVPAGARARLLLGDARRWSSFGMSDRAEIRFRAALEAAPDSADGHAAEAYLTVARLRRTDDVAQFGDVWRALNESTRHGGLSQQVTGPIAGVVNHAVAVLEDPPEERADLRMFVVAEELRDSIAAPVPAAALFLELAHRYPESRVTPKALLAAAALRPGLADSVATVLANQYADSPYTLVLRGAGREQFASFEDSLNVQLARERQLLIAPSRGERERGVIR